VNIPKVKSVRHRVIAVATLLLALMVTGAFFMKSEGAWSPQPEQAALVAVAQAVEVVATSARPTADCRYGIVPGGVYSRDDVRAAVERDGVVADHYSIVNIGALREEHAAQGRRVFVSYRVGDSVYWSRDQVALDPGEVILTDGRREIRARCGNLISDGASLLAQLRAPGYLPAFNNPGRDETAGSSSNAAAGGDPARSSAIGLPALDANPGPVGGTPNPTTPVGFVVPGQGGAGSGSPGGTGGATAGSGIAVGGNGGGSGEAIVPGNAEGVADNGRSDGDGNSGDGNSGDGNGEGGNSSPGAGIGPDGSGPSDGGGSSSPTSDPAQGPGTENPGETGTGNPGGPGTNTPESDKPGWVLVAQTDGYRDAPVGVPEPTTLSLFAIGIGTAALTGRRKRR
jgi:hypothetical protein